MKKTANMQGVLGIFCTCISKAVQHGDHTQQAEGPLQLQALLPILHLTAHATTGSKVPQLWPPGGLAEGAGLFAYQPCELCRQHHTSFRKAMTI